VIDVEDAQRTILEACPPMAPVRATLDDLVGRVLAVDVTAAEDVPPFANSAVDGYAVRAADLVDAPVELDVVGELAAGAAPYDGVLGPGQAVRIMTGAPIPAGADAVAMVEDSERLDGGRVRLAVAVRAGVAVRGVGDDVHAGEVVLRAGTTVTPAVLGVLASVNARQVAAFPRARVAVLSTGDELVTDGSPLRPGQIRESNSTMLAPLLAEAGCIVDRLPVVRDDEAALEAVLREAAASNDAIVTSGGVSMGDYDVVKAVLGRIADMTWMQVAIKPAKPLAFGKLGGVPIFGLPGNPVSSLVSFELFARPALRRMMGHVHVARPSVVGITDVDLRRQPDGKVHFLRVNGEFGDDGRYHVRPVGAQGSHQLAASALADALVVAPDGDGVPAGTDVAVLILNLSH
jgi:molybdenum cofactor synthesis domain-containing protein